MAMIDMDPNDQLPPPDSTGNQVTQPVPAQQHQHTISQDPKDQLPPPEQQDSPSLVDSSWAQIGKRLWDAGSRGVGLGTRDVIQGLSSLPTAALDVGTWPMRAVQRAVGIPTDAPSTLRDKVLTAAGLPTAQTPTEQAISTFNQGASAALGGGALGDAAGLTSAAPSAANLTRLGLQGGVGAEVGKTASDLDVIPWYLKPTVDALGNVLGAKGADIGFNLGAKGVNAVAGNMSPTYNAFVRAGVDPRLVGTVSGGEAGQSAEAALSRVPFASSVLRPVQQNTVNQFGQSVDRTAAALDPNMQGVTAQTTGEALQTAARNWKDVTFPAQQDAAWNPLNRRLAGAAVTPDNYRQALDDVTTQLSLPETQKVLTPGLAMSLRLALSKDVPQGGAMQWGQAQQLRTLIGQTMGVPEIAQSVGMDTLKRAYAGIAQDMRATATQHGQAGPFDAANQVSTDGHAFIDGTLSKVISKTNPAQETITPEQATRNVLNGGSTTMQAVRAQMPGAADTLAGFNLRQAATAKPSGATAYDDTSSGTFLTNINRMRQNTPGGYGALYADPAVQQQVDDLSTVAARLRATERHLNTSGTAEQLGWMGYLKGIYDAAAEGKVGKTIGAAVIPPAVGWGGGRLMTSPLVTRYGAAQGAGPALLPSKAVGLLGSMPELVSGQ